MNDDDNIFREDIPSGMSSAASIAFNPSALFDKKCLRMTDFEYLCNNPITTTTKKEKYIEFM